MKTSLQGIEIFYYTKGLRGERLRKALEKDTRYQKLLKERKRKLTKKFRLTRTEQKQFVLSTNEDFGILARVRELEKIKNLKKEDQFLVTLIKTQLKLEWRKHLIKALDRLLSKYTQRITHFNFSCG